MGYGATSDFAGTQRFRIKRKVGQGAMGVVYEAFDRDRQTTVAIKTLPWASGANLYRFKHEFRALADIAHPNLISLGELVEDNGQWFFTMDFIEGVNFLAYVRAAMPAPDASSTPVNADATTAAGGEPSVRDPRLGFAQETTLPGGSSARPASLPCDEMRLRNAARQLAVAIESLHRAGKVHRDVKPTNILVTTQGHVVLLDFGLITSVDRDANASTQAHVVGTAAYMAPEQAVSGVVGPAADWYSFGVILYEAMTGRLPHTGSSPLEILMSKQQHAPAPPRARVRGVPPDLDDLCVALLARNPDERPAAREILDRLGVNTSDARAALESRPITQHSESPIFLGRESELATLRAAFASSQNGAAEVVLIEGESGMGKSALAAHFLDAARAEAPDTVVLTGRCHERESVPYKALDGVIDSLSRYLRSLPDREVRTLIPRNAALLPRLFPVLGRVEAISLAPRPKSELSDAHLLRQRAFAALRELLFLCAERRPLVMWIDDLQWTDVNSLVALRELLRASEPPSLLLILSARGERDTGSQHSDDALAEFIARLEPRRLRLAPLSKTVSTELAQRLFAQPEAARQAAHVASEANGHPLYIAELVRHAMRATSLTPAHLRLEDAIAARIAELPPPSRVLLEVVAVAGVPLAREIVQTAAKVEPHEFRKHIAILRVAHFVNSHGNRREDTLEPYHDHVRQAVLASLDHRRLRECHERLALTLMTSSAVMRPEIVLFHLEGAGQHAQAADYALEAAARAEKSFSFDLAARLYATALRLGDYPREQRHTVMVAHAEATANAGRQADAARIFLAAAEDVSAADSLELRRLAAESFLVSGHLDDGVEILSRVLDDVGVPVPTSSSGALRALVAGRLWLRLRGLRFTERDEMQIAPEQLRRIDACWSAASSLIMSDTILGMVFQTSHLRLALRSGELKRITMALALESALVACRGRKGIARSQRLARQCAELAKRTGDARALVYASWTQGMSAYQMGAIAEAQRHWDGMQAQIDTMPGMHYERETLKLGRIWAHFYFGNWQHVSEAVPARLQIARDHGDLYSATNFATGIPSVAWLLRGQPDRARRLAREHVERWSRQGFHLQHYWEAYALAQAGIYGLDASSAWRCVDERWAALNRSHLLRISMLFIEAYDLRGRCALARAASLPSGDSERRSCVGEARRCARKLRTPRVPIADAMGLLLDAGVAALEDRIDDGVALLRRTLVAFEGARMAGHAEVARWRLGELVGGDEGAALRAQAREWMAAQQVAEPQRIVQVIAPWMGVRR